MSSAVSWPASLVGTPAVAVIEQAIARQRLSHSILLHGDDHATLLGVAQAIADRLLNTPSAPASFPPDEHPDCFALRPAGKMRQISADATRELIGKLQVSPAVAPRKVAILHEVDRMNLIAANIFLKTLEEPPANSVLLLLTTRPYALLPTIRSRVLHFRFPSSGTTFDAHGWPEWLADYRAWLGRLAAGVSSKRDAADYVFTAYGLIARFSHTLEAATTEAWEIEKQRLPADLEEAEQIAIETGLTNGLRLRLFAEIATATSAFALPQLADPATSEPERATLRRALGHAIDRLERDTGLLRLNLNELAALEDFLLSSLRIWAKR
ncbi:DNA polymerase III subunit gamma/tau [Horticoccus luteus]|uniref:DNA polymerase III subunit gamma/tau n=1 Tax=Horticoccus luteus TaxID=2862869 RepID=A0A8F9TT10_9BACT|nr:DNA polymerase III subunit gamma/tau [Horticoccus luteus]QYM77758.1 DNA polymerase III subunit gamma/tau [Horticoccus luteus]